MHAEPKAFDFTQPLRIFMSIGSCGSIYDMWHTFHSYFAYAVYILFAKFIKSTSSTKDTDSMQMHIEQCKEVCISEVECWTMSQKHTPISRTRVPSWKKGWPSRALESLIYYPSWTSFKTLSLSCSGMQYMHETHWSLDKHSSLVSHCTHNFQRVDGLKNFHLAQGCLHQHEDPSSTNSSTIVKKYVY